MHNTPNIEGMTLRDWFAGLALQGATSTGGLYKYPKDPRTYEQYVAEYSYEYADAMLKARKKGQKNENN